MRNQLPLLPGLALGALLVTTACSGGDDDSDNAGCVAADCARSCFESGYAVGQCTPEGLCRCSGAHDAGTDADADPPDTAAEVEPDADAIPDVVPDTPDTPVDALDVLDLPDESFWPDEGWSEGSYDDAPPPDYWSDDAGSPDWWPDYGYDTSYDDAGTADWYPDYGYDTSYDDSGTSDWYPDYGYDASYDDAGSAACRSWSSWSCLGSSAGDCYATCGAFTLECDGAYCSCAGSGIGVACPPPPGAGCGVCELALASGCCPL